eukprot:CAMPEP_0113578220 /NCGR_PEP_ID=MMETSP0015_2-20120614/29349_1 /TAXON_ID=2838 /ORGANISM="Odontella" /LENGTH=354 /DNA_ID=CAMNT_0000481979 /DNA_START=58 /DNA_END=1119 /DNA_ORIENTATION=+ /assembly_acc=CAM_ASM_000160
MQPLSHKSFKSIIAEGNDVPSPPCAVIEASPPVPAEFGSWDEAVELRSARLLDRLASDCSSLFSARATAAAADPSPGGTEGGGYSTGSTYWISRGDPPRCLLEQIALAILESHLPHDISSAPSSPGTMGVGAEWWTLSIDAEEDSVGFHWDLDYDAEERHGVHRTPYAATVTYLCDSGAPTFVLDKAPTKASREGPPEDGKVIERGWISLPAAGKHMRFRGSWLHGAPDLGGILRVRGGDESSVVLNAKKWQKDGEREPSRKKGRSASSSKRGRKAISSSTKKVKGNKRKKRVSLLVNVWLDGAPGLAAPLPLKVANRLSPCLVKVPFSLSRPSQLLGGSTDEAEDCGKQEFDW